MAVLRNYLIQAQAAIEAHQEMQKDFAYYGLHFRGHGGRIDPADVYSMDKGHTWWDKTTGLQVTKFGPEGFGDPIDLQATSAYKGK